MRETDLMRTIQIAASEKGWRLLRNSTGYDPKRKIHYGLCVGSADLIGWKTTEITPEMVGRKIAVFAAVEVKTERGLTSKAQQRFLQAVLHAGGIALIARSTDDLTTE